MRRDFSGSSTVGPVQFEPRLISFTISNDGSVPLEILMDDAPSSLDPGETYSNVSGETLGRFQVVGSLPPAWRFFGATS